MAKKSVIARDKKREKCISRYSVARKKLIALAKNINISFEEKQAAIEKIQKLPRNSSPSRLNRRCTQCGRPHAVYRKFALCRICLRSVLMIGQVPGGRKSSW